MSDKLDIIKGTRLHEEYLRHLIYFVAGVIGVLIGIVILPYVLSKIGS